jgi:hypothetical protein
MLNKIRLRMVTTWVFLLPNPPIPLKEDLDSYVTEAI